MIPEQKYPSLRSAAILYLLIIPAGGLIAALGEGIDPVFLRLISALFVQAGFTVVALIINAIRPAAIFGRRPSLLVLIISFVAGLAVWPSATWLLSLFSQTLGGTFGNLPRSVGSSATVEAQVVMFGVILPLCQGLLFFGYMFTAARGIGRWRGVLLTAVLFGLFGMFSAGLGMSAILPYLLIGLVASVLTLRSGSIWAGILVVSGFNLGEPLLRDALIQSLLKGQAGDPLSFGWLTTVVVTLLLTFMLVQAARALSRPEAEGTAARFTAPRRGWWLPILAVIILCLVIGYGEIVTRRQTGITRPRPTPTTASGSTSPPLASSRTPAPTASQTPKPAN